MLVAATVAFALQVTGGSRVADSVRAARRDSIRAVVRERNQDRERQPPVHLPVTPELEASAFLDPQARDLLHEARAARLKQDSSLLAYDATTYQRLSVGLGFRAFGGDRLLFRSEQAARVRWSRTGGAFIDLEGRRAVLPMMRDADIDDDDADMVPLPYFPGREALWPVSQTTRAEVDERELVHPLASGSEAYYRYSTGDSLSITLPDKRTIRLRELRVQPRRPDWKLSVGSFWFDVATGQLVRAAYRLAVPMDIWAVVDEENQRDRDQAKAQGRPTPEDDDVPGWVKGIMSPMQANLEAVTIEYGLYGTRFWLPRAQYAEGWAKAGFMRIPFKMEESFKYGDVNGTEPIPAVPPAPMALRDSLFPGDSTAWSTLPPEERRRRRKIIADAAVARTQQQKAARKAECDATGFWTHTQERYDGSVRASIRTPCDTTKLVTSSALPPSIYDPGEQLFDTHARDDLMKVLDFGLQPAWAPARPVLHYGLPETRYNRVEALSTGVRATEELGLGLSLDAAARIGVGDWAPNAELGLSRSNGRTTWRVGAYRRLAVANDWGTPLSFGSSLGALIFGRDDGFYYRTLGIELQRSSSLGGGFTTRFFAEHQSDVATTTRFSLARSFGAPTAFRANIDAEKGNAAGIAFRDTRSFGLDPLSWRAYTDARLETGWFAPEAGDTLKARLFGRLSAEGTVSRGIGRNFSVALTGAGGDYINGPLQRDFFLGGAETIRGQVAGAEQGDAYWLGRLELGRGSGATRTILFGDMGWAGAHSDWNHPGRLMSGVGIGSSFLDGLIRADLSRGLYPRKGLRFDLYLDARL